MIDNIEFVAIGDAEGAEIVGGDFRTFFLTYLWNNAGELIQGIKDGYAAGSPQ